MYVLFAVLALVLVPNDAKNAELLSKPGDLIITDSEIDSNVNKNGQTVLKDAYNEYLRYHHFNRDISVSPSAKVGILKSFLPHPLAIKNSIAGYTKVHLEGGADVCQKEECNLGNLIADSMIYGRMLDNKNLGSSWSFWTDISVALVMAGDIHGSIVKAADGSITREDVIRVLPHESSVCIIEILGKKLLQALETAAEARANETFLQMSGIRITLDYNQKKENRVTSVQVKCTDCDVPAFKDLNEKHLYKVLVPDTTLNGKNILFPGVSCNERLQENVQSILSKYLRKSEFVYPEIEGRLTIIEKK